MGLKRTHTPCFATASGHVEAGPVRVRDFTLASRLRPGPDPAAGEKLDKPIPPTQTARPKLIRESAESN